MAAGGDCLDGKQELSALVPRSHPHVGTGPAAALVRDHGGAHHCRNLLLVAVALPRYLWGVPAAWIAQGATLLAEHAALGAAPRTCGRLLARGTVIEKTRRPDVVVANGVIVVPLLEVAPHLGVGSAGPISTAIWRGRLCAVRSRSAPGPPAGLRRADRGARSLFPVLPRSAVGVPPRLERAVVSRSR